MSSPLDVKRRKLNNASRTLSKPFVSPLRSDTAVPREPLKAHHNATSTTYTPSTLAHSIKTYDHPELTEKAPKLPQAQENKATPDRKYAVANTSSKRKDPAEVAAQRALTSLEFQIRALRNELDTLTQAQHISSSTTDAELEVLSTKWRHASQQAAEELFGTVKERVCRMGGVAAWRESEQRKHDRALGVGEFAQPAEEEQDDDDADCEFDSQGEELPEDEQAYRKSEKRRVRQEAMDAAEPADEVEDVREKAKAKVWQEEGKADDAFTIDMMLRSLNIELETIGYDKHAQRWT
ncbi:hypothetical protein LTR78_005942 [Recurvomyces mirabilis]|uniref:Uncharacterized protein n=1 Tax=Recurvomyces mirabilis TaxID=574656 RepID=A0AAE1C0P4_9PEZI|nr:hypothetical protein LTR78_005942 [Recurvomyces mirabilis]KAK5155248.1 hypothetical protein LTS14_006203 [Recurvomyces mirabilis]